MTLKPPRRTTFAPFSLMMPTVLLVLLTISGIVVEGPYIISHASSKTVMLAASSGNASTTNEIKQFSIPTRNSGPNAIIAAPNDSFWFVEFTGGKLGEFFSQNASFKEFAIPENHSIPASLAIDHLGKIWFSDQSSPGSIWSLDPLTNAFTQYKTPTSGSMPLFILIDNQNNVWFTETTANRIGELTFPSYSISEFVLPSSNSGPVELAFGQNQSIIWITETLVGKVASFNTLTHSFAEYAPSTANYLLFPVGIVTDTAGNVWISEHGGSAVVEFVPGNSTFRKYPTSVPPPGVYPVSAVATIAIDLQGRLWFVEHFSNKVGRLDTGLNTIEEFKIPSTQPAYSVLNAIDSKGNFWFTEFSSNQIAEVPGNISSPLGVSILGGPPFVKAGSSISTVIIVKNNQSASSEISMNVTSSFSSTGTTSTSEVAFNATTLTIPAGGVRAINVTITPDSSLPTGNYSIAFIASSGNVSTNRILFLNVQEQFSALNWIQTNYQFLFVVLIVVLAAFYFGFMRKKPTRQREKVGDAI